MLIRSACANFTVKKKLRLKKLRLKNKKGEGPSQERALLPGVTDQSDYVVMACIAMACVVMACVVVACGVMAYIAVAYIVMARSVGKPSP